MTTIFPSLISAPVLELETTIKKLEPYCAGFHLDVMDFHFVPNLTWGPVFINAIRQATHKTIHVHLMVDNPEKYLDKFTLNPHDIISVHPESVSKLTFAQLLNDITKRGLIASIALNPSTPLETIITLPVPLNHVLLMSVQPGFSGQKFIPHILQKLQALVLFKKEHKLNFKISVDGGINQNNISELVSLGVDQVAIAAGIFGNPDPVIALRELQNVCQE